MGIRFRTLLLVLGIAQVVLGVGFALRVPFFTQIWPIPNTSPLSFIFIGSIFAAAGASALWCLYAGENGSLAGVFLDYVVIFIPLSIYFFLIANGNGAIILFGAIVALGALFGLVGLRWSLGFPIRDPRPQPVIVKVSFVIIVLALIALGTALVMQVPNVLPWAVTPEGSVIYGWMFLGAVAYFAYSVARPSWMNTGGQLAGFLAYDLVLIAPLISHFERVDPQLMPNLILYVVVVSYSGLLGIYYLFVNKATRIPLSDRERVVAPETVS